MVADDTFWRSWPVSNWLFDRGDGRGAFVCRESESEGAADVVATSFVDAAAAAATATH
jgi:hypothetical protein